MFLFFERKHTAKPAYYAFLTPREIKRLQRFRKHFTLGERDILQPASGQPTNGTNPGAER